MYYDLAATELAAFAAVGSIGPKCLPFGTIRMCYSGNETLKRAKVNAYGSLSPSVLFHVKGLYRSYYMDQLFVR